MRIFIAGIDGYLGWPLALSLTRRGHEVLGADNGLRRQLVKGTAGSWTATDIPCYPNRIKIAAKYGFTATFCDLTAQDRVGRLIKDFQPDAIVHLAHIPSAPYSMIPGNEWATQFNNMGTTWTLMSAVREFCPEAHFVTLGTMGEYGTPKMPIPEGYAWMVRSGDPYASGDVVPFPRQPGSFYHAAKVHATVNFQLACKFWGLACTDIMQGVVFGVRTPEMDDDSLLTRFDFDEYFGTAINRFCAQAVIGEPITVYGKGGQTRGFLPLADSMQCIRLLLENPAEPGEHRVVNQIEDTYSVRDLAHLVADEASAEVVHLDNPREEAEEHFYEVEANKLRAVGYVPSTTVRDEVRRMLTDLEPFADRIGQKRHVLTPKQRWDGRQELCHVRSDDAVPAT